MNVSTANLLPSANLSSFGFLSLLQYSSASDDSHTPPAQKPNSLLSNGNFASDLAEITLENSGDPLHQKNTGVSGNYHDLCNQEETNSSCTRSIQAMLANSNLSTNLISYPNVHHNDTVSHCGINRTPGTSFNSNDYCSHVLNIQSSTADCSESFSIKNEIMNDYENLVTTNHSNSTNNDVASLQLTKELLNASSSPESNEHIQSNNSSVLSTTLSQSNGTCKSVTFPTSSLSSGLSAVLGQGTSNKVSSGNSSTGNVTSPGELQLNEASDPMSQSIVSHFHNSLSLSSLNQAQPHNFLRHLQVQPQHTSPMFSNVDLVVAAANQNEMGQQIAYNTNNVPFSVVGADCISTQKAVAFLAGPKERIHVLGNPVEHCPRCQQEGHESTGWRPHRHIGELKIRYICERHFNDLESNHHFDIPLCPICNQVLYLYDYNSMLGVSNARRLHKYVLKCRNRHVLPLLDVFCQTKRGGERCNANFKLQWCYGTMVKRCEGQKNRDHDLWWVRYKNEWKQRRTIIRYKKDFLSHLTDAQRSLLLGLGSEGEPPTDPKSVLGSTFDALLSSVVGNPNTQKLKKRSFERSQDDSVNNQLENYDINSTPYKQRYRTPTNFDRLSLVDYSVALANMNRNPETQRIAPKNSFDNSQSGSSENLSSDKLQFLMGTVLMPPRNTHADDNLLLAYMNRQQSSANAATSNKHQHTLYSPNGEASCNRAEHKLYVTSKRSPQSEVIAPHTIVTGTPTPPLKSNGISPVAVSVVGEIVPSPVLA